MTAVSKMCIKGEKGIKINPLKGLEHLTQIKINTIEDLNRWRKGQQILLSEENEQKLINRQTTFNDSNFTKFAVIVDYENSIAGIAEFISPNKIQPIVVFNADG